MTTELPPTTKPPGRPRKYVTEEERAAAQRRRAEAKAARYYARREADRQRGEDTEFRRWISGLSDAELEERLACYQRRLSEASRVLEERRALLA